MLQGRVSKTWSRPSAVVTRLSRNRKSSLTKVTVVISKALYFGSQETPNGDAKARTALKSAEKFLRRAAKKDQKNIRAFGLLGEVLARSEQPRKAIGAFNFALQLNPKYYNAWLQRAKVLLGMGLFEDVKKSYIVLARNDAEMATELLITIDTWAADREEALTTPESSFMEWRAIQGA
jgi:tetratricopeptide (TPR) repeat protein